MANKSILIVEQIIGASSRRSIKYLYHHLWNLSISNMLYKNNILAME